MFSRREPTQPQKVMMNMRTPTISSIIAGSTDRHARAASGENNKRRGAQSVTLKQSNSTSPGLTGSPDSGEGGESQEHWRFSQWRIAYLHVSSCGRTRRSPPSPSRLAERTEGEKNKIPNIPQLFVQYKNIINHARLEWTTHDMYDKSNICSYLSGERPLSETLSKTHGSHGQAVSDSKRASRAWSDGMKVFLA